VDSDEDDPDGGSGRTDAPPGYLEDAPPADAGVRAPAPDRLIIAVGRALLVGCAADATAAGIRPGTTGSFFLCETLHNLAPAESLS
jgi:hypothetical protein